MSPLRRGATFLGAVLAAASSAAGGTAVASNSTPPTLRAPRNHAHLHGGAIRLTVFDPGLTGYSAPVFVTISPRRSLDRFGHLTQPRGCDGGRCDFVTLRRVKGHPGLWSYRARFNFPGFWAVTPGLYYWQASHTAPRCEAHGCELVSAIQTFRVVR